MKTIVASVLTALIVALLAGPASAGCNDEVAAAFKKQREAGAFRMATNMVDERGVVLMTLEYVLPFKMRQTVQVLAEPKPREMILIGDQAWGNIGEGWARLPQEVADQLVAQMRATVVDPGKDPLEYSCAGDADLNGRAVKLYKGVEPQKKGETVQGLPVRRVYVDAETGLPVRNEVAPEASPEKPFFRAVYTYPGSLTIDPPAGAQ